MKTRIRTISILGSMIVFLLLGFYVYQVNAETSGRYSVQDYQKRISELSKENKNLEINSAQAGSLNSIAELIEELGFEKTDKIEYIKVVDTLIVIK